MSDELGFAGRTVRPAKHPSHPNMTHYAEVWSEEPDPRTFAGRVCYIDNSKARYQIIGVRQISPGLVGLALVRVLKIRTG